MQKSPWETPRNKQAQAVLVDSAIDLYLDMARHPQPIANKFTYYNSSTGSLCISPTSSNLAIISNSLADLAKNCAWSPELQPSIASHAISLNKELAKTEPHIASLLANILVGSTNRNPPLLAQTAAAAVALHQGLPQEEPSTVNKAYDDLAVAAAPLLAGQNLDRYRFIPVDWRSLEPHGAEAQIAVVVKPTDEIHYGDFKGTLQQAKAVAAKVTDPSAGYRARQSQYATSFPAMVALVQDTKAAQPGAGSSSLPSLIVKPLHPLMVHRLRVLFRRWKPFLAKIWHTIRRSMKQLAQPQARLIPLGRL